MNFSTFIIGLKSAAINFWHSYFSIPNESDYLSHCYKLSQKQAIALDLGCGNTPKNPFNACMLYGVDIDFGVDEGKNILSCDLGSQALPFDDCFFDYVTAFDLIEHIPRIGVHAGLRTLPFIFLMNEVFRVLKPGGIFLSHTPAYPRLAAFTDPTHVNVITSQTFKTYFCNPHVWAKRYGFCGAFDLLRQGWDGQNLVEFLVKPK